MYGQGNSGGPYSGDTQEERNSGLTRVLSKFRLSQHQHVLVPAILLGTRAAWGFSEGLRRGCSEQGGHRRWGVGWPGSRAVAGLQSDSCPLPLATPLSGITGNKVELMLMVYDTNSF